MFIFHNPLDLFYFYYFCAQICNLLHESEKCNIATKIKENGSD